MPGFSAAQIGDDSGTFFRAHHTSKSGHQIETKHIKRTALSWSTYPEYPLRVIKNNQYFVGIEGYIYDSSSVDDKLLSFAELIFSADQAVPEAISEWIGSVDGDFVLLFVNRDDGQLAILNDVFARLPIYYQCAGQGTVCSRDIGVVRDYNSLSDASIEIDQLGVAQSLQFRYTLGNRTVFEGIKRLPPGSLLRTTDSGIRVDSTHQFDFSSKPHAGKSVRENAEDLARFFTTACQQRSGLAKQDIVSLSGGLDSRAIAAAHHRNGAPFIAATNTGSSMDDVEVAKQVADALDAQWNLYEIADSSEGVSKHQQKVINRKRGMSPAQRGSGVEFHEYLTDAYGSSITTFSGDGGDKALPDLTSSATLRTDRDVVNDLIETGGKVNIEDVASITRCSQEEVIESIQDRLNSYPESNLNDKRAHFMVRERGINWLGENEDVNRHYHWHVAPFYSRPFFERAMACPHTQKTNQKLQREFLRALSPVAVSIRDENTGQRPGAIRYRATRRVKRFVREQPHLRMLAISLLRHRNDDPDKGEDLDDSKLKISSAIEDQLDKNPEIDEVLSVSAIRQALRSEYTETSFHNLLTATLLTVRDLDSQKDAIAATGDD